MTSNQLIPTDAVQTPAIVTRMFAHPKGMLGRIGAKAMLRSNDLGCRWVAELLDLGPTDRFLDVGCGPGGLLRIVRETGAEVEGVDSSAEMVRQVKDCGVEAYCAPAHDLPLATNRFTAACAMHTIDFWEFRARGLLELHRVLRPNALLCVVVRGFDATARPWNPSRHGFTDSQLDSLEESLQEAGFSNTRRDSTALNGERLIALTSTTI